jgi:hypothetical protein
MCAIIITGKAWSTALRGENRTKLACLVQILEIFVKKHFLAKKLLCTLLKIEYVFACNLKTGRDISKIPTDLDSAGQIQFP